MRRTIGVSQVLISMKGICKSFNENLVLNCFDFELFFNEVHAIMGENGEGKTVLMRILAGLLKMDSGEIYCNSELMGSSNSNYTGAGNTMMVHQEINLLPELSVADNIFLGIEPTGSLNCINYRQLKLQTEHILNEYGVNISYNHKVRDLTPSQKRIVELVRVVIHNPKVVIFDDITDSLSEDNLRIFFKIVEHLKTNGASIIFISHNVDEVKKIADRVTILKDGKNILTTEVNCITTEAIIQNMFGTVHKCRYPKISNFTGNEVMRVNNLVYQDLIKDISFTLLEGEILGICGFSNSGANYIARVLFGIYENYKGNIYINNKKVSIKSPRDAVKNGICYITENLIDEGLNERESIEKNISISNIYRVSRFSVLSKSIEKKLANYYVNKLSIKYQTAEKSIKHLSPGNKKKVILAKWLNYNSNIFLFDNPTSGLDISSKVDVYNIINSLSRRKASIILYSNNLEELTGMCDRILVINKGKVVKEVKGKSITQQNLFHYASTTK